MNILKRSETYQREISPPKKFACPEARTARQEGGGGGKGEPAARRRAGAAGGGGGGGGAPRRRSGGTPAAPPEYLEGGTEQKFPFPFLNFFQDARKIENCKGNFCEVAAGAIAEAGGGAGR